MISPSIERLHHKLNKHIQLVQAYTELEGMEFIIRTCRLKPYDYLFGERKIGAPTLYRWWVDEFGNSLILKKKKIKLIYNDLSLDRKQIVSTDLYYGLSLDRVTKMSRLVHLVAGKDEDLYQDCYLLTFLGIDEHLRSYLYWFGEWQQVSPLIMGMQSLQLLADHTNIKYYNQIGNKENYAMPCVQGESWLSFLPASDSFLNLLNERYEVISNILGQAQE
jgi:hypothetical protein